MGNALEKMVMDHLKSQAKKTPKDAPEVSVEVDSGDDSDPGLEAACDDLIDAVHAKDAQAVGEALKAAFDCLSSKPEEDIAPPDEEDSEEE